MKQLSCDQCRERWEELINKSTFEADPQFADVRAHLESCADCRKIFDLLIATRQELQQLPSQKAPVSLRANILRQIENPQKQSVPWWSSLFVSPQRLAWASGAIVAVFLVALLMRPEHQTQILQTAPKVLSNHGQIEEHNHTFQQPQIAPPKPAEKLPAKKAAPQKPQKISPAKPSRPVNKFKHSQKPLASVPRPAPNNNQDASAPQKIRPVQKSEQPKNISPQPQLSGPPAPINNNSLANGQSANEAADMAKSPIPPKIMQRSMATGARGPEGSVGAMQTFKSQRAHAIINWSKIITSDYDVANAKIIVILEDGLTFADETQNQSERTLWQGTLFRGKQIPLNISLHSDDRESAKLQLKMIDTDTQKVLLDKTFDVK